MGALRPDPSLNPDARRQACALASVAGLACFVWRHTHQWKNAMKQILAILVFGFLSFNMTP